MMRPRERYLMKKLLVFLLVLGLGLWLAKQAGIVTCQTEAS